MIQKLDYFETTDHHSTLADDGELIRITVNPKRVALVLLGCVAALVVASFAAKVVMLAFPAEQYGALNELCKRFYLDFENNVPAWFSSMLLLASAALFGVIATANRRGGSLFWYWLGLALAFAYLAIDEATYIHEILIVSLRDKLDVGGVFYFAWVIPGALMVGAFGLVYVRFLFRIPRRICIGLIVAGSLYVGGALGMEMIGGLLAQRVGFDAWSYIVVMTIEESMELTGIVVLIYCLVDHILQAGNRKVVFAG